MEVTFYEDPACSWCWAFQPVSTAFAFEFRNVVKPRYVMGGLRDRPTVDVDFVVQQWKKAEAVSGMPFDCGIWRKHVIKTTFVACRAVKAAAMIHEDAALRLLRRIREALYVEQIPIDDQECILALALEIGLDTEGLRENLASGRAETLFARDRMEASQYGFGFPTIVLRCGHSDPPIILQGAVPYSDLLQALSSMGISPRERRRFRDTRESWLSLFQIHPRLTLAEIHMVAGLEKGKLTARMHELGIHQCGPFYSLRDKERDGAPGPAAQVPRPAARPKDPLLEVDSSKDGKKGHAGLQIPPGLAGSASPPPAGGPAGGSAGRASPARGEVASGNSATQSA
jgi:protein-disulfide isomerase-like protein with CxxC motif